MTIAIIVGVVLGVLWFMAQHCGGSKATEEPVQRSPQRRIHTNDIPATWQGQPISDRYKQKIIDEDEEIPF